MKAILVCGGLGTRLRPHTYNTPKPMLRLGSRPIVEYIIMLLKKHGVTDVYLTIGYLKEQFKDYFKDGADLGINIHYAEEEENLNTAGSTISLKDKFHETFIVMMGDHFTEIDLTKMVKYHKEKGGIATMGLKPEHTKIQYGVVETDEDNTVKAFKEKPIIKNYINTGIYIFEPEVFDHIKEKEDYAKDVFPRLLESGKKIVGYEFSERWMDIGQAKDYEDAHELFKQKEKEA